MKKTYLMTPGPAPVPPEVALKLAQPIIHHRSDEYHAIHAAVVSGLRNILGSTGDILPFPGSGTAAMESAVVNTLSPGDTAVVIRCGKFSNRWAEICGAFGATVVPVDVEWGRAVDPAAVAAALAKHPAAAVFATLCETSTTVKTDIAALARLVKPADALLVVDAISGLACSEFRMDKWGVDVAVAAGQKGLMVPTGLAIAAVSGAKAWRAVDQSRMPKYYFDWKRARVSAGGNETAWSAPASLMAALAQSLDLILREGIETVLARHARLAHACRAGVTALGLRLLAPDAPADGVTGVWAPPGISGDALKGHMAAKYGVHVAGGQEQLKDKIIRIAHMGYADTFDIITAVSAIEMALTDLGHAVERGRGVSAAEAVLSA
ncbi:MAG: alanine--glyoxylate aminotransferase family protein [Candidatus Aureabacteria bacterium]|nr:alanine--glyoxylate aminotransferase family protein [Candidatus Auribacterota bacterium]